MVLASTKNQLPLIVDSRNNLQPAGTHMMRATSNGWQEKKRHEQSTKRVILNQASSHFVSTTEDVKYQTLQYH